MEIIIALLSYVLHCFTAFSLIYSHDEAKIWGNENNEERNLPHVFDLDKEEISNISELPIYEINNYIKSKICPKYHYFLLIREVTKYQSDCDEGFKHGFFLQLFSLLLSAQMLVRAELFECWPISVLFVAAICTVSCSIIYWIYKKYWRCDGIRIKHFSGIYISDGGHLGSQYEYLCSIKDTVIFRHCVRRILYNASMVIFLLFFFHIPE